MATGKKKPTGGKKKIPERDFLIGDDRWVLLLRINRGLYRLERSDLRRFRMKKLPNRTKVMNFLDMVARLRKTPGVANAVVLTRTSTSDGC